MVQLASPPDEKFIGTSIRLRRSQKAWLESRGAVAERSLSAELRLLIDEAREREGSEKG